MEALARFACRVDITKWHAHTYTYTHRAMEPAAKIGHAALQNAGKEKGKMSVRTALVAFQVRHAAETTLAVSALVLVRLTVTG